MSTCRNERSAALLRYSVKIFKQMFPGLTVISFFPALFFVQDVNVSNTLFKGLVGLQVNLTHPDKAKKMKNRYEHDKKKLSEVTWICSSREISKKTL